MATEQLITRAPGGAVVPFPRPAPPYDKAKRRTLKRGDPWPVNVCPIRARSHYDPQPVAVTIERAAICAIFEALKPKQKAAVLSGLWRASLDGDDGFKFYIARAMLRGERV